MLLRPSKVGAIVGISTLGNSAGTASLHNSASVCTDRTDDKDWV